MEAFIIKAFDFWQRVDLHNPFGTVRSLSEECGIDYNRMKRNRTDVRIPNVEDIYRLAQVEKVSIEFLITGIDSRPRTIADRLYHELQEQAPAILQGLIDTYIEKKGISSQQVMA